jgi:hypothetical protein
MAKKKNDRSTFAQKLCPLLLAVVGATLIGVIALSAKEKLNKPSILKTAPTLSVPKHTVNEGVYTNYQYGFRLKYPKEIFVKYELADSNKIHFYTSESLSASDRGKKEEFPEDIFMDVITLNFNYLGYKQSEAYLKQSIKYQNGVGIQNSLYDVLFQNIKVINENGKQIVINYDGPDLYTEENFQKLNVFSDQRTAYSNAYGLTAIYLANNFGLYIDMTTANKRLLDSNLDLFETIVESIETFNPQIPSN